MVSSLCIGCITKIIENNYLRIDKVIIFIYNIDVERKFKPFTFVHKI